MTSRLAFMEYSHIPFLEFKRVLWKIFSEIFLVKDFCNKISKTYNTFWNVFSRINFLKCIMEKAFQNETRIDMPFLSFYSFDGSRKNFVKV